MTRPLFVGIDLGTTNSTAAAFDGSALTVVRNAQGGALTPSVVRIDGKGAITVGQRARKFLDGDPGSTRGEFKRLMGTDHVIEFASGAKKRPEELAAEILRALRHDVKEQLGVSPERAAISVPALFEVPQVNATAEAARLAGFEHVELIQEPIASAIAAGFSATSSGSWLVYDLGGGTFDASLLETRDGLLRVVGHDGDNFLGGRDFDNAIVDWILAEVSRASGASISRSDAAHAAAVRKLKLHAEEAKIDLTREESVDIVIPGLFGSVGVEVTLTRAKLEELVLPLVDRSIAVCERLVAAHGASAVGLAQVVLVGGPTVMPLVRRRVGDALGASLSAGLDPMTLVAQGAALWAATANLDARPKSAPKASARKLWLQYPSMSSDLEPHVVGKVVDVGEPKPTEVRFLRDGSDWRSAPAKVGEDGGFVAAVTLEPRKPNVFRVALTSKGAPLEASPETITIVQGVTITDPPLSRTIGVALANDGVRVFLERGAPLPAKRTITLHTVESVAKGDDDFALRVPIVQGELPSAHLCRLVGALEIRSRDVKATLPAGSSVEVTVELDRGGRLSARALVPAVNQVFEQIEHLIVPETSRESLEANLEPLRARVTAARADAFRRGLTKAIDKLGQADRDLESVAHDVAAARGGDEDAGQRARRAMIELDALLAELEQERAWPELETEAKRKIAWASSWISEYGTKAEQSLYEEVVEAVEKARKAKQPIELTRQLRLLSDLGDAAYFRHPDAWRWMFDAASSRASDATDLVRAQDLVRQGRAMIDKGELSGLRPIVQKLLALLPSDVQDRKLGWDSGVKS